MGDRRVVFGLVLFVILVSTLGVNHVFAQDPGYSIYENSDMGIRIDYPSDWIVDDSVFGSVTFGPPLDGPDDDFSENLNITLEYLNEPITLEEYSSLVVEGLEFAGYSVTDSTPTTLADNPAIEISVTVEFEGQIIELIQIETIKDQTAYLINSVTLSQTTSTYQPIYEKMKDSFEILSESETTGQDVRKLYDEAIQSYLQGSHLDALSKTEIILIIQENHYDALILKGTILAELGNLVEAEKVADKILDITVYDPSASLLKGIALIAQEKYEDSIPYIDAYLLTAPEDSTGLSLKGIALAGIGQRDEGITLIDKALRLHPDFPFSLYAKGLYYYMMHDYDQAILFMDKAIKLDPNPAYRSDMAAALMAQGKLDQSEAILDQILEEFPNHVFALNNKGVILLDRGDNAGALEYFDRASEIDPDNLLFLRNKIAALSSSGITDLAQIAYNQLLQLNPNYDEPLESITSASTSLDTTDSEPIQESSAQIPDWIRNNAEWWAQGAIGDSDFVSGIQFLIKEGIMTIPETAQGTTSDDSQEIPSWIKNNADWWSQGLISDDDFVKGIQFLIEQGIISI